MQSASSDGALRLAEEEEEKEEAKKEGFGRNTRSEEEEEEEAAAAAVRRRRSSVPRELESALIEGGGDRVRSSRDDSSGSDERSVIVKSKKIGDSRYFPSLENDNHRDDEKDEENDDKKNYGGEEEEETYEEGEIRKTRTTNDRGENEEDDFSEALNEEVRRLSVRVSNNEEDETTAKNNTNNNDQDIDENDVNLPRDLMSAAIGDDSLDSPILPPWSQIKRRNSASEGREQISYDFVDEPQEQREQRRSYVPMHHQHRNATDDAQLKAQLEQRVQQQQSTHQSQTFPFSQPYRMPENHGATRTLLYRLLCPNARAGSVIGKNGEKVKQLQRDSGAKIKVEPPVDSTISERVIAIEAQDVDDPTVWAPSQIALLRIVETIVLDAERNTTIGAAEEHNGHIVVRLLLPSSQIRNVIGRFGNVIERIRVGSGSHVRVLPSSETPRCAKRNDEVLQISAESMENVASALAMITTQLRLDPPVRAHELPGGTKIHCDRASSEAVRRAASGIVNEGGILTSVDTTATTTTTTTTTQHQGLQKPPISPSFDATSPDVSSYYAQKVSPGSSDVSSSDSPQSPVVMYSSSQVPMVHGAYAEQFPDSSDVCGLFNISNFEGLDDTEPESRIAPGIVTRTFCVFEIKNALDSASKKRAKGIIEHAAEETKCKVTQRPIGEEQVKNKSMLLTVSGTTEKVVAVKTLVKMRLAKGFADAKREERALAQGRRTSGEYYQHY